MMDPRYIVGASGPLPAHDGPIIMRWPSWMDSQYMTVATRLSVARVSLTGVTPVRILRTNPRRIALHIYAGGLAANVLLAPHSRPDLTGYLITAAYNSALRLCLISDGALPTSEWYASSSGATDITVAETELE